MADQRRSPDAIPDDLRRAKRAAVERFLTPAQLPPRLAPHVVSVRPDQNVVAVGVGPKLVAGAVTEEPAVRLYVERKVPLAAVPPEYRLPTRIEGVAVDVLEAGRFLALAVAPAPSVPLQRRRLRPARPGCSIGFQFSGPDAHLLMAGTFGAVVERGGRRYVLSNNHVLANENALPLGSPIFQPGLLDGGDPERDQIARLSQFVPLRSDGPNTVDAAIAEVLDPALVRPTFLPRVGRLRSAEPIEPAEGMAVHKVGRTTGYTRGEVFDVSADLVVGYLAGTLVFQDQVLIRSAARPFSDQGDSGSVIVDRATGRPVGLLFAGSPQYTAANPLGAALAQLGVTVVR